jgi:hypothetical protein
MKLLAWIRAPFAWKVVGRHCHWDGSGWGHGLIGREVFG